MSIRKFVPLGALGLLGAIGLGLVGCGGGSSNPNTAAHVRAVNAIVGVTGSGAIDVAERSSTGYIPNGTNIAFGTASKYGTVAADNVNAINIFASPTGTPATTLATGSYTQTNTFYYTVVPAGIVGAAAGSATAPKVYQFVDNIPSTQLQNGQTAFRIINASPGLPTDITISNDTNGVISLTNIGSIAYGNATTASNSVMSNGYFFITPGTYTFTIRDTAGTAVPLTTANPLAGVTLKAGTAYTFITVGTPGNATQPFTVKVIQDFPFQ